jgi:uncharacterized protein (TIGR02453 family)
MPASPHFTPAFFQFLRQLAKSNSRDWFQKNKPSYDQDVKAPMLRFITDLQPRLAKVSPHIDVDPKPVGGSMQRLNRDTRFSRDKSPYKTSMGAMFPHRSAGQLMLGYHISLDHSGQAKAYVGIWEPDGPTIDTIRARILADPAGWKKALSRDFVASHAFEGEALKRPPKVAGRQIEPDHPLIEDLKRKSHAACAVFTEKQACSASFIDAYVDVARAGAPLMAFLCKAVKLPF